jgi:hypothetical protein
VGLVHQVWLGLNRGSLSESARQRDRAAEKGKSQGVIRVRLLEKEKKTIHVTSREGRTEMFSGLVSPI